MSYITYDCGTQSTKICLYRDDFKLTDSISYPNKINYPKPGWAEMEVDDYLVRVKNGIKELVRRNQVEPEEISAICGDGIIMGIVGVDEDLNPVTPYTPYLDSRAVKQAERMKKEAPIWIMESGNSVVECLMPPIMAMWMIENNAEFQKRGKKIMNNGPYVASKLAGLKAKDAYLDYATLGGWIIGYDAVKKQWSEEQLKKMGIDKELLPKLVPPDEIIGTLDPEIAKEIGLCEGIPVVAGAGDTMQSLVGCGVYEKGTACDVAGTAAMFAIMTDGINEELSKNSGLYFSIGTLPNTYFYWGYIRTGGLSLQWFRDQVMDRKDDQEFYNIANQKAAEVPMGSNGTIFFPYLQGGQGFITNASGCFINMTSQTNLGEMWRAILESIAYEYKSLIQTIRDSGINIQNIYITEGGSYSDVWNQIKADMLKADVTTMKTREGATLSNAILAAKATGKIDSITNYLKEVLAVDKKYKMQSAAVEFYDKSYTYYNDLLKNRMTDVFNCCQSLKDIEI